MFEMSATRGFQSSKKENRHFRDFCGLFSQQVRCVWCREVFCCADCRRNHERIVHHLTYECSICRQEPLQIRSNGTAEDFIKHLVDYHSPLHCLRCQRHFTTIEDYSSNTGCILAMESNYLTQENTMIDSKNDSDIPLVLPTPPSSLGENTQADSPTSSHESVNCSLDHFLSSLGSTMTDGSKVLCATPYPRMKALSKMKVSVAPRTLSDCLDDEEKSEGDLVRPATSSECEDKTNEVTPKSEVSATPAPMHATSTPTHPSSVPQWNMFQNTCSDSPLSEIDSPGTDGASPPVSLSDIKEYQSTDKSSPSNAIIKAKMIKSIMARSRRNFEGQESTERCVTFSNSVTVQADGEISTEKLKAEHKGIESPRGLIPRKPIMKAFRRPRIQTPGPIKQRRINNPRFQALLNHFQNSKLKTNTSLADTPAGSANIPARALLFRQHDSPSDLNTEITSPLPDIKDSIINDNNEKINIINGHEESPLMDGEIFKSCIDDSPVILNERESATIASTTEEDLKVLSRNIACCIKRSIDSAMEVEEGQAELQIKVTFTKKKFTTCTERNPELGAVTNTQTTTIWSSLARAVRGVIWGALDGTKPTITTGGIIEDRRDETSEGDSATKRKLIDLIEPVQSPLNHKKFRYEGRIRARRPLDRMLRGTGAALERSNSAGGADLVKRIDQNFKNKDTDILNHSF